jgi:drug/metabolite transporter (DMT)-like permease
MKATSKAHLAVIGANLLFGINFSMVKLLTPALLSSYALNVVRIVASVSLFWILYLLKPTKAGIDRKDIPRFLLCAITGVAINQILFIKGLSLTSTIHGSLLILGTPIFITVAAAWLLHEAFTRNKLIGLLLGIGGALLLVLSRSGQKEGTDVLLGDVLVILNSISYAFYFVWVRPLMEKYRPVHVIRWVFTFGMLLMIPIGIADLWHTDFSSFSSAGFIALSFVIIGGTFLPYLFNVYGIKYLGPGITGTYIYSQPFFAAIIGLVFLGEQMGIVQLLAGALIASGVLLVNRKQ